MQKFSYMIQEKNITLFRLLHLSPQYQLLLPRGCEKRVYALETPQGI